MSRCDSERLHPSRDRWLKEQQLIRKKYQIPYNMTYTFTQCVHKPATTASQTNSIVTNDQPSAKLRNITVDSPPIYCSKCQQQPTKCLCADGLGQWWTSAQQQIYAREEVSRRSLASFADERHVRFDSNVDDLTSSHQQTVSQLNSHGEQYVLLNWNERQSLLNFLQVAKLGKNLSSFTTAQLHELITKNEYIHVFDSITALVLSLQRAYSRNAVNSHVYIDPAYYSTLPGAIPWSQSRLLADNCNLQRALHSIQYIADLLGVRIGSSTAEFPLQRASTRQRQSILNEQIALIASRVPYNTFRRPASQTS